jgi:mRNA interferase MazF
MILGRSSSFAYLSRVLVVEVTTRRRNIPQEVTLGAREGLPRPCVANLDAMRTVRLECLSGFVGCLATKRHPEVKRALGYVLHWPELTSL